MDVGCLKCLGRCLNVQVGVSMSRQVSQCLGWCLNVQEGVPMSGQGSQCLGSVSMSRQVSLVQEGVSMSRQMSQCLGGCLNFLMSRKVTKFFMIGRKTKVFQQEHGCVTIHPTDRPTNQPTNRRTDRVIGKCIISFLFLKINHISFCVYLNSSSI